MKELKEKSDLLQYSSVFITDQDWRSDTIGCYRQIVNFRLKLNQSNKLIANQRMRFSHNLFQNRLLSLTKISIVVSLASHQPYFSLLLPCLTIQCCFLRQFYQCNVIIKKRALPAFVHKESAGVLCLLTGFTFIGHVVSTQYDLSLLCPKIIQHAKQAVKNWISSFILLIYTMGSCQNELFGNKRASAEELDFFDFYNQCSLKSKSR